MPKAPNCDLTVDDSGLPGTVCRFFDFLEDTQFWIKDRRGRYCWVNRGFLLNYSLEDAKQVVGRTDFELSPPHLADQFHLDDNHVLRGRVIAGRIEMVGRFDHTAVWSVTHKLPVRDKRGRIVGTAGITRPVAAAAALPDVNDAAMGRVIASIREDCAGAWSNRRLAKAANLSVRAFERHFRACFRISPQRYIRKLRVRMATHALVYSALTLSEIASRFGFADQSHFTREFRRETRTTPGEYRRKYRAG